MFVAAAWGGGVNSTALIVEWIRRGHRIDLALFADTGGEKPATYAYRDGFAVWLKARGIPFFTVTATVKYPTLEAECLGSKTLPSLAYGFKKCSQKWKRQPQDKFCNNHPPCQAVWNAGGKVVKLIGYDAGEERRAKIAEDAKYAYRYPLIEWGIDREGCIDAIEAAGLPIPPKSSCFFCPASRPSEVLKMQDEHPDLLKRALAIEEAAKATLVSVKGLGRSYAWSDLIEQDRRQGKFLFAPPIPCECYDDSDDDA